MPTRAKMAVVKNGHQYKEDFDRINERITMVAQIFNDTIKELRQDIRTLDSRVHGLLEEGVIAGLVTRVTKIEEQTALLPIRGELLEKMQIELARIDLRVNALMWAFIVTAGPAVTYLVTKFLVHLFETAQ